MRQPILISSVVVAALVVVACSSGSTASVAPNATASASTAASEAPPSSQPSQAVVSTEPSIALPSFSFPSDDKELEALIPDDMCGGKAQKLSLKGDQAINGADEWTGILTALGKTVSDISAAGGYVVIGDLGCSVTIIRIKGAEEGALRQLAQQEAAKEGKTYTAVSLGGKDVFRTDPAKFEYAYVKGDGVIIVMADTEAHAAEIVGKLP